MKDEIKLDYPNTKPFSAGIRKNGFVFVSGQGGLEFGTGRIVGPDLKAQTVRTMDNIGEVLTASGLGFEDVVKMNIYLKNRGDYQQFNEIYGSYFKAPYPARTTVYCDLNYDLLVEIDAIAAEK